MDGYEIMVEPRNRWTYKVTVYKDGKCLGHAITNDVETAAEQIIKESVQ